jgi:hypothetical protein
MHIPGLGIISQRLFFISAILLTLLLFPQCRQKPFYEADISGVDIDSVRISRYEEALFSVNPFRLQEELEPYSEEFRFFLGDGLQDPLARQQLFAYITDPLLQELYEDTKAVWPDLEKLEEDLTRAFRFYRAHFPEGRIPRIYSYVSGIDYQLPIKFADYHAAIGLDNYLGSEYPTYGRIGIPLYQARTMAPEFVAVDLMRMMAELHIQQQPYEPETLLDFMVYEGKMLFFLDCMFPHLADSIKVGYTSQQQDWMQENRALVWTYFVDNELLYSSDRQMISRFIGDAPFTSVFSRGSAPKTAVWTGWQIVREYARRHPEVPLRELLNMRDARQLLQDSRFRGR